MHLNRRAREIVEPLLADPGRYGADCHRIGGAWVVDCGVRAAGGSEAGLLMARAALAGLATVELHPAGGPEAAWPGCPWPAVAVASTPTMGRTGKRSRPKAIMPSCTCTIFASGWFTRFRTRPKSGFTIRKP